MLAILAAIVSGAGLLLALALFGVLVEMRKSIDRHNAAVTLLSREIRAAVIEIKAAAFEVARLTETMKKVTIEPVVSETRAPAVPQPKGTM